MSIFDLETERLIIREYQHEDLEDRRRQDAEIYEHQTDEESAKSWLEWTISTYRELATLYQPPYGDYAVTLKASRELIGSVGLVRSIIPWGVFDPETPVELRNLVTPEFGLYWAILPSMQGKGYATEAAAAFVDVIFEKLGARCVVATTDYDNLPSQKVMEKLGMLVQSNPHDDPFWLQVVGKIDHPLVRAHSS